MLKFLVVILLLSIGLVGCASGLPNMNQPNNYQLSGSSVEPISPADIRNNSVWISPGKVEIGNFHPGAEADYPITIHNGKSLQTDQKRVTTDPNETVVDIPISSYLSRATTGSIVSIVSDNPNDKLEQVGFKYQGRDKPAYLTVVGFQQNATRILTIIYKVDALFSVRYSYPGWATSDYQKIISPIQEWVLIADDSPVLAPLETREVMVTLTMPNDAIAPLSQFEFWIIVAQANQGVVGTEVASRWLVSMRQDK